MSKASEFRDARNAKAHARLAKSVPAIFPAPVLIHARARPFVPPMPRLCVESYWRHHPIRADRLARALAAKSGAPAGWTWRLGSKNGLASHFRAPPAPYREDAHAKGPGFCCVCGQPVFRFGWHADLWGAGPNTRAEWHSCCVTAWKLWTQPVAFVRILRQRARRLAPRGQGRLLKEAEADHRVPLFRVWREHRHEPWPGLLAYWGVPNLQMINRDSHVAKNAQEAAERAAKALHRAAAESPHPLPLPTSGRGPDTAHSADPDFALPLSPLPLVGRGKGWGGSA